MSLYVLAMILVPAGFALALGPRLEWTKATTFVAILGWCVAFTVIGFWLAAGRRAAIELDGTTLVVRRRGKLHRTGAIADAHVARWDDRRAGVLGGILIAGELRIGALDVWIPVEACRALPGHRFDVSVEPAAFGEILVALNVSIAGPRDHLTVELVPNTMSLRGSLGTALPWFLAMIATAIVGPLAASRDVPMPVIAPILGAILVAGLVGTIVRSSRAPAKRQLRIDVHRIELRRGDTVIAAADRDALVVERHNHVQSGRYTLTVPVLVIALGKTRVAMSTYRETAKWSGAGRGGPGRFVVGYPDWRQLVAMLD